MHGFAIGAVVLGTVAAGTPAAAREPQRSSGNVAEEILQDSKKVDPVTPQELSECIEQWDPETQMTKQEWAESCRATLKYFPEEP